MESIEAFTGICCIGRGRKQIADAIFSGACGLRPNDFGDAVADVDTYIGRVHGIEHEALPESLAAWDCRDHRLSWAALQQDGFAGQVDVVAERFGAHRQLGKAIEHRRRRGTTKRAAIIT